MTLPDSRSTDCVGSISYWSDLVHFELLAGVTLGMRQLGVGALVLEHQPIHFALRIVIFRDRASGGLDDRPGRLIEPIAASMEG